MGGVSKGKGARNCAVKAVAPLPPGNYEAEQHRVGLTLGAAQL